MIFFFSPFFFFFKGKYLNKTNRHEVAWFLLHCEKHLAGGLKLLAQSKSSPDSAVPEGGIKPSGFSAMAGFC